MSGLGKFGKMFKKQNTFNKPLKLPDIPISEEDPRNFFIWNVIPLGLERYPENLIVEKGYVELDRMWKFKMFDEVRKQLDGALDEKGIPYFTNDQPFDGKMMFICQMSIKKGKIGYLEYDSETKSWAWTDATLTKQGKSFKVKAYIASGKNPDLGYKKQTQVSSDPLAEVNKESEDEEEMQFIKASLFFQLHCENELNEMLKVIDIGEEDEDGVSNVQFFVIGSMPEFQTKQTNTSKFSWWQMYVDEIFYITE